MKSIMVLLLSFTLFACSTTNSRPRDIHSGSDAKVEPSSATQQSQAELTFQETNGALRLNFDANGNWVSIRATATADMQDDSPSSRESALMIATMRAKRTVAEFLNNDVKSFKSLNRIAKSYARSFLGSETHSEDSGASDDADTETLSAVDSDGKATRSEKARQANRLAFVLTEKISDSSAAILKGAYVSSRTYQDGKAVVELTASRISIEAARSVSRLMGGAMQ